MSIVKFLVLGVVGMHKRAHGYAVHRELVSWHVESWTSVKPGSIYFAMKHLALEGKLREVGTEDSEEGPERTTYELTKEGSLEFTRLLKGAFVSTDIQALSAGIAFMHLLPREEVLVLLRQQQKVAGDIRDGLMGMTPNFPNREEPPHTKDLLELWSTRYGATADWVEGVIRRLEAGEYTMAGE